jgi:ribosomal protein S18 acetylase RimI-like enzyme
VEPVALLGLEDIPELHDLVHRAYRGESARRGWTHEADLLDGQRTDREALAELLTDPDQTVLGLSAEGRLVGCVQVSRKPAGKAYLGMLSVDPELQARGLGRMLIEAAEAHARGAFAATVMEMTVIRQRTELIDYYLRRGYARTGREEPFPATDPRLGLPKRDDLGFVVLAKLLGTD